MAATKIQESAQPETGKKSKPARDGTLRDDLKRFTRDKILKAALSAFMEHGYRSTSVERIVDLAGTTAPTFYRHFSSKSDLLPHLSHHLALEVGDTLGKLDAMQSPSPASVRAWLNDFISMWDRVHWLCEAFWEAVNLDADIAATVMSETMSAASVMTSLLKRRPEAEQQRLKLRMAMIIVVLDRIVALHYAERDKQLAEQMLEEFAYVIWASLYAKAKT